MAEKCFNIKLGQDQYRRRFNDGLTTLLHKVADFDILNLFFQNNLYIFFLFPWKILRNFAYKTDRKLYDTLWIWIEVINWLNSLLLLFFYQEDLEKRGGVRSGGARETREPRFTIGWLLPKDNIFSNLPAFQDLNGILKSWKIKFNKLYHRSILSESQEFNLMQTFLLSNSACRPLCITYQEFMIRYGNAYAIFCPQLLFK